MGPVTLSLTCSRVRCCVVLGASGRRWSRRPEAVLSRGLRRVLVLVLVRVLVRVLPSRRFRACASGFWACLVRLFFGRVCQVHE